MNINEFNQILSAVDANQLRILGTLCEKQLNGSKSYPMTVNDARIACNQKSGRNPQMSLDSDDVREAAKALEARKLITIDRSGRTDRYAHCVATTMGIDNATLSILTAVILRGPLSVAQIRSASRRFHPFSGNREIEEVLSANKLFAIAPRVPGQRGHRYTHTLEVQLTGTAANHATAAVGHRFENVRQDLDQLQTLLEPGKVSLTNRR